MTAPPVAPATADAGAPDAAHAAGILLAAIAAADPAPLVTAALDRAPELAAGGPIHVLALGKAAGSMAAAALAALGTRVCDALVVVPHEAGTSSHGRALHGALHGTSAHGTSSDAAPTHRVRVLHASHPLPDATSLAAGRAIEAMLSSLSVDDVVVVLISGGSSSLAVLPCDGVDVEAYADCVDELMRAGADIHELNAVRRQLDLLKGGGMARLAGGARMLGLLLSDVVGDRPDVIGSGPLSPTGACADDAIAALRRRHVWDACRASIRSCLLRAADDARDATAGREPTGVRIVVIGSNRIARAGAAARARHLGYRTVELDAPLTGEARKAGEVLVREALRVQRSLAVDARPVCLIVGGETTVTVRGSGTGGRNQELVLAGALALGDADGITLGSIGTDGVDGPTRAAGAVADAALLRRAAAEGFDAVRALDDNDSHTFFDRAGATIVTGPTGTNVMDVGVAVVRGM